MPRGRKPKYPPELTFQQYLLLDPASSSVQPTKPVAQLQEALQRPFEVSPTWNHLLVKDVHLDHLHLPSRACSALHDMQIDTIDELLDVRRLDLLGQKRLGQVTLDRLRREILDVLWPPLVGDGQLAGFQSLAEIVENYVRHTIPDSRKANLALGRLAPDSHRAQPLREFGEEHGLSRERIRQIVDEAFERLGKPAKLALLRPLWEEVWPILQSWDRPVPVPRLAEGLRRRLGWVQTPPDGAIQRLFTFHPELALEPGFILLEPIGATSPPALAQA
ncbi:MAG: DNA-directed RNA polymerase subunit alpha C-terminal domain-containing protein [Planctomycetota bacterium]|jgi:hypothetical protein